jgi:hypothetical protein
LQQQYITQQVLRWHQGAVQLLFFKGLYFTSFGGKFPTIWHRLYSFDQATYYLQAIPGYMLLLMPIIYGKLYSCAFGVRRTYVQNLFLVIQTGVLRRSYYIVRMM